jgi:hypothetical protein
MWGLLEPPIYWDLDPAFGISETAGNVTSWVDGVKGYNFGVASGSTSPQFILSEPSINGQPTVLFDGVSQALQAPAAWSGVPVVHGACAWFIFRQLSWTANATVFSGSNLSTFSSMTLSQETSTPNLNFRSGQGVSAAPNNSNAVIGAWYRGVAWRGAGGRDTVLRIGGSTVTATVVGGASVQPASFRLGSGVTDLNATTAWAHCEFAKLTMFRQVLSQYYLDCLDEAAQFRWPAAVY